MDDILIPKRAMSVSSFRMSASKPMLLALNVPVTITSGHEKQPIAVLIPFDVYADFLRVIHDLRNKLGVKQ